jgi:hypothetical protein
MEIYDRRGAAERVGRSARTIRRWEERGWLTFTLNRVRELDLLEAEMMARDNARRGGRRKGDAPGVSVQCGNCGAVVAVRGAAGESMS